MLRTTALTVKFLEKNIFSSYKIHLSKVSKTTQLLPKTISTTAINNLNISHYVSISFMYSLICQKFLVNMIKNVYPASQNGKKGK